MALHPIPPPDELFDARGQQNGVTLVPLTRPFQQGDVFCDVNIPGIESQTELAMLFLHPCTMRTGVSLRSQVTMVAVDLFSKKRVIDEAEYFSSSSYNLMPLPDMDGEGKRTYAADFLRIGTVNSSHLHRSKRVAGLTFEGQQVLHQRMVHHFTRLTPLMADLEKATKSVELEIQAQNEWVEAACFGVVDGLEALISASEEEFSEWMDGSGRREKLKDPSKAHLVLSETSKRRKDRYGR